VAMSFRPEEIDLPIDPDWIKGSSAMKITSLKTWRERLSLYYDESQLGDDLRSRLIECVTILRHHDTDYARQRDSFVIRASPRQMAFDAWRKWVTDWHASVTAYQEQQLDTDQSGDVWITFSRGNAATNSRSPQLAKILENTVNAIYG